MMAQIIRSLIYLIVISSSAGGIYYFFYPTISSFVKATILTAAVQVIFFILYNNILRFITRLNLEKEALALAQLASRNKILIECQGCKKMNSVDIDLSEENSFICDKCSAENKVQIDISTILPTNIIYDK
tara:strand:+ start:781 stop:1170 length:390 start_codon:yes stop_codon:yes gene_type:complete